MSLSKLWQPKFLLILICALFLFTRFYKIGDTPPSVYWDEASIGYNAYSVALTGKDEWGESFPLHFRAFGEFKLPVFIYSVVPSVVLFGLNEFSVRFPAVLYSLGVVVLVFLLAKRLTGNAALGLLSSFFISVSPWFFIFSRTGYEATAGLFFYLLGIHLFLKITRNNWNILFSTVGFILSAYSYNSFRIIAPLTVLVFVILNFNDLKRVQRFLIPLGMTILIAALSIIPIYRLYKYDSGAFRMQAVGAQGLTFFTNYLSHLSPDFLLFKGDKNLRSQQTGFGQLHLPELGLLALGLLYIICRNPKGGRLVLALALIAPIPASLTRESPHALRAISMVPFISIISAFGVTQFLQWFKKERVAYIVVIIAFMIFFANYFINFLTKYPAESATEWQYPYKKIYAEFKSVFGGYERIVISDELAQPYIFALFYLQYGPEKFQQSVVRNNVDNWGFSTVKSFDKFEFGKINKLLAGNTKTALIFATEEVSKMNPFDTIKLLNGEIGIWVIRVD